MKGEYTLDFLLLAYLTVSQKMKSFFYDEQGNEQTGFLLNLVITLVIAGVVLQGVRSLFPQIWQNLERQIRDMFGM